MGSDQMMDAIVVAKSRKLGKSDGVNPERAKTKYEPKKWGKGAPTEDAM